MISLNFFQAFFSQLLKLRIYLRWSFTYSFVLPQFKYVNFHIFNFTSSPQRVYNKFTQWPAPSWLDSSIGKALHRYRRGHGFESRSSLNFFFQAFFSQLLKLRIQLFRERLSNWKALKRTRQYRKAWWVVVVHSCIVKFTSFQRDGRRCYEYLFACVKRNKMDSELLTCLLKFIEYFPDYLSALLRTILRFFGQPLSKQLHNCDDHSLIQW